MTCSVKDCGRRPYARDYCQTHHRQMLMWGETREIRPYRERRADTVKYGGLKVSPECAAALDGLRARLGLARGAAMGHVLEKWAARRKS